MFVQLQNDLNSGRDFLTRPRDPPEAVSPVQIPLVAFLSSGQVGLVCGVLALRQGMFYEVLPLKPPPLFSGL